jgi:cardiolipin synthase
VVLVAVPDWATSLPVVLTVGVLLVDFGLKVAALGIIPGNRKPSSAMAWLLLILLTPLLGIAMFVLLGSNKLGRGRHDKQLEINAMIHDRTAHLMALNDEYPGPSYVASVATLNRHLGALPALSDNAAELFSVYRESIAAMTEDIETAERFVHIQFYITAWDDCSMPWCVRPSAV